MKLRIPLWLALAGWAGTLALAVVWARAQAGEAEPPRSEYPYLPARYGEIYFPTAAEWQALRLTALCASKTRITRHFSRQHLNCFLQQGGMILTLDLAPEPEFKHYAGGGKFSAPPAQVKPALEEAIEVTLKTVRSFFPEIRERDLQIRIFVNSESVGAWTAGELRLNGE